MAWRLQSLYGQVSDAVRSVVAPPLAAQSRGSLPSAHEHVHILQVGGHPAVLPTFLAHDGVDGRFAGPLLCEVTTVSSAEAEHLPFSDRAIDCAVAIDWLPDISASQRERSIAELCRVSRKGVVVVNPCQGPEVAAAVRAVNDLHRAARGMDHPRLGRLIEFGLPDADTVRRWLERFFPIVDVRSLGHIALWQAAEALILADELIDDEPSAADIAAAVLHPVVDAVGAGEPGYRTLIVATLHPALRSAERPSTAPPSDFAAVTMHHALEAAAQRRALDALVSAVTTEREREREEFRASIASLAVELRDLDGRAEFLARELRARDQTIGNQQTLMAENRRCAADVEARLAEAHGTIADQQAVIANHVRHDSEVEACVAEAQRFLAHQNATIADYDRSVHDLRTRLADAERVAETHQRFGQSRAGRALRAYTRVKSLMLGWR